MVVQPLVSSSNWTGRPSVLYPCSRRPCGRTSAGPASRPAGYRPDTTGAVGRPLGTDRRQVNDGGRDGPVFERVEGAADPISAQRLWASEHVGFQARGPSRDRGGTVGRGGGGWGTGRRTTGRALREGRSRAAKTFGSGLVPGGNPVSGSAEQFVPHPEKRDRAAPARHVTAEDCAQVRTGSPDRPGSRVVWWTRRSAAARPAGLTVPLLPRSAATICQARPSGPRRG